MQFTSPHGTKHNAAYRLLETWAYKQDLSHTGHSEDELAITARASSTHNLEWPHAEEGHGNNEGTG